METFERKLDARLICSILATGIMSFSGVLVETAMNITFPTLMAEFGIGTSMVQWITTGYLLVTSLIVPVSSYLKRRFRTKSLFLAAITLFIAGTAMAAAAPVYSVLLAGRLIQGLGTGIALPLMFNIVLEQTPYSHLGLMMGTASLITAVAPAVGPTFGGFVVSAFGWRMIFILLLFLLAVSFVMGVTCIRQVSPVERPSFDLKGYLILAVAFASMVFAATGAAERGWTDPQVAVLLAVCLACLALFALHSSRCESPLIRVSIFRCPTFTLSVCVIVLFQFIVLGMSYLIPNYAQLVLGKSAFQAGLIMLPGCAIGAVLAPLSGRIYDKMGPRKPILIGCAALLAVCCCFAALGTVLPAGSYALTYLFFGLSQGLVFGNTMTNGIAQLDEKCTTDGNAVFNTLQQLSGALGTAVVTSIVAAAQTAAGSIGAQATATGSHISFVLLAIVAAAVMGCSVAALACMKRTGRSAA